MRSRRPQQNSQKNGSVFNRRYAEDGKDKESLTIVDWNVCGIAEDEVEGILEELKFVGTWDAILIQEFRTSKNR